MDNIENLKNNKEFFNVTDATIGALCGRLERAGSTGISSDKLYKILSGEEPSISGYQIFREAGKPVYREVLVDADYIKNQCGLKAKEWLSSVHNATVQLDTEITEDVVEELNGMIEMLVEQNKVLTKRLDDVINGLT